MEQIIGRISFGNTRAGKAIDVLKDEIVYKHMWEHECLKKDLEIELLKEEIRRLKDGCKVEGKLAVRSLPKRQLQKQRKMR